MKYGCLDKHQQLINRNEHVGNLYVDFNEAVISEISLYLLIQYIEVFLALMEQYSGSFIFHLIFVHVECWINFQCDLRELLEPNINDKCRHLELPLLL